jgi:hypothetical protein
MLKSPITEQCVGISLFVEPSSIEEVYDFSIINYQSEIFPAFLAKIGDMIYIIQRETNHAFPILELC